MTEAEKAYQYFVIAVPESEEQAKAYFWARKALRITLTPPNEWVSVEERLPPPKQNVLAYSPESGIAEADYKDGVWMQYRWSAVMRGVTHWMPLPAPPDRRPPEGEVDA